MAIEPVVVLRPEQPYVAIGGAVTLQTMGNVADRVPEVFGWLESRGIAPAGAPFFKYDVIDMVGLLQVEVGVPITEPVSVTDHDDIVAGTLPAGNYISVAHVGHPDELEGVTAELLAWAGREGHTFDVAPSPEGERWACRLESYETDPREQPDMSKWCTVLYFKVR